MRTAYPLAFAVALLAVACSDSGAPGECQTNDECPAGEICDAQQCIKLCTVQTDCPEGLICQPSAGKCVEPADGPLPNIDDVTGNDAASADAITDGIMVHGQTLADASFELRDTDAAAPLTIRTQSDTLVELVLPEDVTSGDKLLVATNSSGSDQTSITLTLPDLDGELLLQRINDEATSTFELDRLPVGESSTTVARGDHEHDTLTPEAFASIPVSHAASGQLAEGESLQVDIGEDATDATVMAWRKEGDRWVAIDPAPVTPLIDDPAAHAYYDFEETSGSVLSDATGSGHNLGLGANYDLDVPGSSGSGMYFGGTDENSGGRADSVSFSLALGDELTLSAWIFPHALNRDTHWMTLNPDNTGHAIYFSFYPPSCSADRLALRGSMSGTQCSASSLPAREWTHLAAVYDAAAETVEIYVNGRLDIRHTGETMTFGSTTQNFFRLGQRYSGSGYDFTGRMDEIGVFGRALSAEEIARLYERGAGYGGYEVQKTAGGTVTLTNRNKTTETLRMLVVE